MYPNLKFYATVQQVAKILNVTPQAIRYALKERRIRGQKFGKIWLIPKKQIIQKNRNGDKPDK